MSRETGFAIEIRERYQDVAGDRWPATVDPQPDELLSSWLHRLAVANGVAPRSFAGVLGFCGGMWSARLDLRLSEDLAAWLGARTGVASEAISAMVMSDGAGAVRPGSSIALCVLPMIALPIFGGHGDWPREFPASGMAAACGTDVPPAGAG